MKMMNCERWRCCTYSSTRLTLTSTNAQNDALLHRLVHTQLLSGSLNPELGLTSAQRKKAMEGRILELSGSSKLGQGEKVVRAQERDKASKRVREGILEKQKQRREKLVQEVNRSHPFLTASSSQNYAGQGHR